MSHLQGSRAQQLQSRGEGIIFSKKDLALFFSALRCGELDHGVGSVDQLERALSARQQHYVNCLQRQLAVLQADASC